jgi:CHAT domain-containing protein/tetratricopeptide (TPR) repeat protein
MANQYDQAIPRYEQVLAIRRELQDRAGEATALANLGFAYMITNRFDQAAVWYEQALAVQRELKDRGDEATTLDRMAYAYRQMKQLDAAVRSSQQALAIHREMKDPKAEASTLDDLSLAYYFAEDYPNAIIWLEQERTAQAALKDRPGEAKTFGRLAYSCYKVNQNESAAQFYEQALAIFRDLKDRRQEASTLNDFAFMYYMTDQFEKAIALYEQELAIVREMKDRALESTALNWLGDSYEHLKEYEKATEDYGQALSIRIELKDRAGEASTLNNLGILYDHRAQYDQAIGYFEQALAIRRELKDRAGEADALHWLGSVYNDRKEDSKAISYHEQTLAIRREIMDRSGEAAALESLGLSSQNLNEYEKAMGYYEDALAIDREINDRTNEGKTLNELGAINALLSHYDKELDYYQQALAIAREVNNRKNEGLALFTLGSTYLRLSKPDQAIEIAGQALLIAREVKNQPIEFGALILLGASYAKLGQSERGLDYFSQALTTAREDGNRTNEGRALILQAVILNALKQQDKAISNFESGLAITREVKDRSSEGLALNGLGVMYLASGQYDKATSYLEQALAIARASKIREFEAPILSNLMVVWASRKQPRLAIVMGKESINLLQEVRGGMQNLDPTLQQGFLQANKSSYRYLANLLAGQGRLAEAQQVLDLQKQDEFMTFVQRDQTVSAGDGRAMLTPEEVQWEARYKEVADRLTSLGVRREALLAKADRTPADEQELGTLDTDLEAGNRAFESFLNSVESAAGRRTPAAEQVAEVREAEGLMETLHDLGPGTVAVYTIEGEEGFRSILITADVQKGYSNPIAAAELNKKILAFRELVRNPDSDPRPLAKELYDILVKPMEHDLAGAQAQTIMWSLDGALRYIPIAALYDGQQYMVERFRNVVFTPASQSRLKDPVSRDWRGLGLGVSLAHEGFRALPNVPGELHSIIQDTTEPGQGVLPGVVKLDGDFTKEDLREELRKHFTVVHLASHFDFVAGTDKNSFLLLGDGGKLTLDEFRNMPQALQGVELLTLSACDTAVGGEDADGKEVEGFAVLAQRQGAKAVVATLWSVADQSTALLMKEFYRLRMSDSTMTKAEALRQAQLELLRGTVTGQSSGARGVQRPPDQEAKPLVKDPQRPYAHPYFWAPFLLMGNWK